MLSRPHLRIAVLQAACSGGAASSAHDMTADSTAIAQALDAYVAAVRANDLPRVSAAWVDDAVYINVGMPTVRGRAAFDSFLQRAFSGRRVTDVEVSVDEITTSGGLGYLIGAYSQTFTLDAGGVECVRGRFVFVWRRQSDGSWKIARGLEVGPPP